MHRSGIFSEVQDMTLVFATEEERDAHPMKGYTFKEHYGIDWENIDPRTFKLWVMYIGADDSRKFHNLRSYSRRKDPLVMPKNQWIEVSMSKLKYWPYNKDPYTGTGEISREKQFLEDVKFLLKYRKADFKISLQNPFEKAELIAMQFTDRRLEIAGVNVVLNPSGVTKQQILDEIESRFDVQLSIKMKKVDLINEFVRLVEEQKKEEMKNE